MSTTVIASRFRSTFALARGAGPELDVDAVQAVLARHGLRLIEGSDLATANEIVASEGLDPVAATALAEDLRALGLHARVVNQTGLVRSRRVGSALAGQALVGMAGFGALMMGLIPVVDAIKDAGSLGSPLLALPVVFGVAVVGWAAVSSLFLRRNGGNALRIAGVDRVGTAGERALTDQLSDLVDDLPSHVADDLIAKARALEAHAKREPDGKAAQELQALVQDLRQEADGEAAEEAAKLRAEVARARRVKRELGKG